MENRFDNKVLFVLRGEQVQGGSYCIMGFPALRARTKHELASAFLFFTDLLYGPVLKNLGMNKSQHLPGLFDSFSF